MKKIPTLFKRDANEMSKVLNEVNPECQWVVDGEGVPTNKFDGTCCLIENGIFYRRREIDLRKISYKEAVTQLFFKCADSSDLLNIDERDKLLGWQPVGNGTEDRHHREGFANLKLKLMDFNSEINMADGTYELVGQPIQGNPYNKNECQLWLHGSHKLPDSLRDFESLKSLFGDFVENDQYCEGIVWHHQDGRMAKLKVSDFFGKKSQLHKMNKP